MKDKEEQLIIALWVAVGVLLAAVLPIWPYALYMLLRLYICAVSIYAIYIFRNAHPKRIIFLGVIVLLFNPVIPVHLTRMLWAPIDLGLAFYFWMLSKELLQDEGKVV